MCIIQCELKKIIYRIYKRFRWADGESLKVLTAWWKVSMDVIVNISFGSTVVPALGDSSRERPSDVYCHVINGPIHFYVKLPAIGGHLPNADVDSHLLVVSTTCYNGQCKQMPRFRWSFQPKIARGAHPKLWPIVRSNVHAAFWWPQATFHIESKCLRDEPRDCGNSDPLVTSVSRHHVVKDTSSVSNPRCRRRELFLVLTSCRTLAIELVRQNANSTYGTSEANRLATKSHCGRAVFGWPSGIRAAGLIWNTWSDNSWLTLTTRVRVLYNTSPVVIIMMH